MAKKTIYSERSARLRVLLTEAREAAGLTQKALAVKLKGHQSYVSNYERGQRRLDVVEFLDVAEALGINPHEVLALLLEAPPPRSGE